MFHLIETVQTCIRARGGDAWACLAPALQCLCDGRACCPALAMQLVIFVLEVSRFTGAVTWLFQVVVHTVFGTGWFEMSTFEMSTHINTVMKTRLNFILYFLF